MQHPNYSRKKTGLTLSSMKLIQIVLKMQILPNRFTLFLHYNNKLVDVF